MLEAGKDVTPDQFTEHHWPYDTKYRDRSPVKANRRPIQTKCYACNDTNIDWWVDDVENPYTTPKDKPFDWIRIRALGGRSLAWGRGAFRLSDLDFKAASRDGHGIDWPISYKELEPHYLTVERFIGVSGREENLAHIPDSDFQPPIPLRCAEVRFRDSVAAKYGRSRVVTEGRSAVLTKALNGRPACHYCGPCHLGCITNSYFSSPRTTIAAAQATGKFTLLTDSVVSHVTTDRSTGMANGVAYIERESRRAQEIRAKVVVLCASTLESTRIMLNSADGGLGNSSGALGHYLMDHLSVGATAILPFESGDRVWEGPPRSPNHILIPRFRNVERTETNGFVRGYHTTGGGRQSFNLNARGFGESYKQRARQGFWRLGVGAFCEVLPRYENYVELDPEVRDAWGIPALRIHMQWGENEKLMAKDAVTELSEMLATTGARTILPRREPTTPGLMIHELGTARMGANPKNSVLNKYCQSHDVKNVFVTDGACYASSACQNPTLNMMAITVHAMTHAIEAAKRGDLV